MHFEAVEGAIIVEPLPAHEAERLVVARPEVVDADALAQVGVVAVEQTHEDALGNQNLEVLHHLQVAHLVAAEAEGQLVLEVDVKVEEAHEGCQIALHEFVLAALPHVYKEAAQRLHSPALPMLFLIVDDVAHLALGEFALGHADFAEAVVVLLVQLLHEAVTAAVPDVLHEHEHGEQHDPGGA